LIKVSDEQIELAAKRVFCAYFPEKNWDNIPEQERQTWIQDAKKAITGEKMTEQFTVKEVVINEPAVAELDMSAIAELLYEAYGDAACWKNYQGKSMPRWGDLPENIRTYWTASADKARTIFTS